MRQGGSERREGGAAGGHATAPHAGIVAAAARTASPAARIAALLVGQLPLVHLATPPRARVTGTVSAAPLTPYSPSSMTEAGHSSPRSSPATIRAARHAGRDRRGGAVPRERREPVHDRSGDPCRRRDEHLTNVNGGWVGVRFEPPRRATSVSSRSHTDRSTTFVGRMSSVEATFVPPAGRTRLPTQPPLTFAGRPPTPRAPPRRVRAPSCAAAQAATVPTRARDLRPQRPPTASRTAAPPASRGGSRTPEAGPVHPRGVLVHVAARRAAPPPSSRLASARTSVPCPPWQTTTSHSGIVCEYDSHGTSRALRGHRDRRRRLAAGS